MNEKPGMARLLRVVADLPPVLLAGFALALLLWTASLRLAYPYDLEWMEGGMLLHSLRVLEGQPIYVRPSADFIPYLYPPLYSWVVAGLSLLPGVDLSLELGRAVSLVGTLAAASALIAAAKVEKAPIALGVGAAGLYLSCYDESGAFYDLVRTDGLLMGLTAWALVAARAGWLRAAGLLLTAAYATKHTFAIFGLPTLIWLLRTQGRASALRFAAWSVGPALTYTVAMQLASGGEFLTWMIGVPGAHGMVMKRLFPGAPKEILSALPWTSGMAGLIGLAWARRWSAGGAFWLAQGLLAIALSAFMRGHTGGFTNVLMPGHWTVALWAALAAGAVARRWEHPLVRGALGAVIALQIGLGRWDPPRFAPSPEDEKAGDALVERLRQIDGEVLSPYAPWLPVLAGKRPYWHLIALWDIDYKRGPYRKDAAAVDEAIAARRWDAVLVGDDDNLGHGLKKHYERAERIKYRGRVFFPKTGWRRRPEYLYTPLPAGQTAEEPARGKDVPPPEPDADLDPQGGGI